MLKGKTINVFLNYFRQHGQNKDSIQLIMDCWNMFGLTAHQTAGCLGVAVREHILTVVGSVTYPNGKIAHYFA